MIMSADGKKTLECGKKAQKCGEQSAGKCGECPYFTPQAAITADCTTEHMSFIDAASLD